MYFNHRVIEAHKRADLLVGFSAQDQSDTTVFLWYRPHTSSFGLREALNMILKKALTKFGRDMPS